MRGDFNEPWLHVRIIRYAGSGVSCKREKERDVPKYMSLVERALEWRRHRAGQDWDLGRGCGAEGRGTRGMEREGKGDRDWIMARGLNARIQIDLIYHITWHLYSPFCGRISPAPPSSRSLLFYVSLFLLFLLALSLLLVRCSRFHMQPDMSCVKR